MSVAEVRARVRSARAAINKGSKYALVEDVENVPNPFQLRRPSGIMQLDADTGGGLPAGGICYISGPDGAGKTWLLYNYFAMHQQIYKEEASILYAPVEFLPDYKFMRTNGCKVAIPAKMVDEVNKDRLLRRMPVLTKAEVKDLRTGVGVFDILRTHTSEEMLDAILKAYASGAYNIIAVDSVSVLQASAEAVLKTLAENPQQAANATLLTRFMQHYHPLTLGLNDQLSTTTMIFTAQVRANRHKSELPSYMAKWEKDWTTTGGANAMKHGKLIDVQVWSEGKEKEKVGKGDEQKKVTVGKTVKWNLIKGKAGTHDNKVGEYNYRYASPGDHIPDLIATAMQYGAVIENDGKLHFIDKLTGGPLPSADGARQLIDIPGIQGLRNLFAEDPASEFTIRREILTAAGVGTCLYKL